MPSPLIIMALWVAFGLISIELQWNPLGGMFDAIITNQLGTDGRSKQPARFGYLRFSGN